MLPVNLEPYPLPHPAGCLAPESNILCCQWSFGNTQVYTAGVISLGYRISATVYNKAMPALRLGHDLSS